VGGKRYWRIESFNDLPSTTHADILRVLRRARENVIAGMIEGNPRPWHERWLQTLRCLCSERWSTISVSPRSGTHLPGPMHQPHPLSGHRVIRRRLFAKSARWRDDLLVLPKISQKHVTGG